MDFLEHVPSCLGPVNVTAALAREAASLLHMSHVVLVDDPYLDAPMVIGPFPGPVGAARFADEFRDDLRYEGCESPVVITVVPLQGP